MSPIPTFSLALGADEMIRVATVPLTIFWGQSEETFYLTGDPTDFKDSTPDATLVVRNIACHGHLHHPERYL